MTELTKTKEIFSKLEERSKLKLGILRKDGKIDNSQDFLPIKHFLLFQCNYKLKLLCVPLATSIHLDQLFKLNTLTPQGIWQNSGWWSLKLHLLTWRYTKLKFIICLCYQMVLKRPPNKILAETNCKFVFNLELT